MPAIYHSKDTPESIVKRSNQADPIICYIVVNKSLNMSIGKTAAQVAHSVQFITLRYKDLCDKVNRAERGSGNVLDFQKSLNETMTIKELEDFRIFTKWTDGSFRKVVLAADTNQFNKIKERFESYVIKDAGLTELEPGTDTVLALWPMYKSNQPNPIKKLQTLK